MPAFQAGPFWLEKDHEVPLVEGEFVRTLSRVVVQSATQLRLWTKNKVDIQGSSRTFQSLALSRAL